MTRPAAPSSERRGGAASSVIAALVFNASLAMLPFAGAGLVQSLNGDLIDFSPNPGTIGATRSALNTEASRFAPRGAEARRTEWNNLIARELSENDAAAARGFALSAFTMLGSGDTAKIRRQMAGDASDRAMLTAALPVVDTYLRPRFRTLIAGASSGGGFDVMGDARETAETAQRWLGGEEVDPFLFKLGGLTLPAPDAPVDDVRLGASVMKIAKNGARLRPDFVTRMDAAVAAAAPDEALRRELSGAFQNRDAIVDEGQAAALAFRRAQNHDAYASLAADLAHIGAAARAASPAGAAMLLAHVRDSRDLRRLELLAVAGGERAVAIGKRTPTGLILNSARGRLRNNPQLFSDVASVALAVLGMLIATHLALSAALRRTWESQAPPPPPTRLSKADAQRRSRTPQPMDA